MKKNTKYSDIVSEYQNLIFLSIKCIPAEEADCEIARFDTFHTFVVLTLTLDQDRVIRHTVVYHSSVINLCTYIPNFVQIRKTFCGRTDTETSFIRSTVRGVNV